MLSCPKCRIPVGEMDTRSGVTDVVCPTCRFAYRFFLGKLVGRNSRQFTVQRQTTKQSGVYKREYELRVELPSKELKVFQFSVPGQDDWILVRKSDWVSLIYTLNRSNQLEELLTIIDTTAGASYAINQPGANSRAIAVVLAVLTFFVSTYVFW